MIPPTLRTAILLTLELVDEIDGERLRRAAIDYRSAHTATWLRWFARVSEPRFEIAMTRLQRDGRIACRRDRLGGRFYSLVRQWPAAREKMGQAASRMLSGPIVLLILFLAGCAIEATCHEGRCSLIHRDAARAGSVGLEK